MPDPESDTTVEAITAAVATLMDDAWVDLGRTTAWGWQQVLELGARGFWLETIELKALTQTYS